VPPLHPRLRVPVVTALGAVAANTLLQVPMQWGEVGWNHAVFSGVTQLVDLGVVWLALVFLVGLTGRLWLSTGLLLAATLVLAAASAAKMSILDEPVVPSDRAFLTTPGFLASMVPPVDLVIGVLLVGTALAVPLLVGRYVDRRLPAPTRSRRARVVTRVAIVVVLGLLLADTTRFNDPGNLWRWVYDAKGATWKPYSQAMNYRANGVVGGLLYNMPVDPMPVPDGYGEAAMTQLAQKYAARAAVRNEGRDPHALDDVDVVTVLSESFADPDRLAGVHLDEDVMPHTRARQREAWSGETLANYYGTGTSSMEFQVLTGQSMALFDPQVTAPYQDFMATMDSYPSAVGWFAAHGHDTIAVHPYTTEMYRRSTVYPMLGFDDFVHDTRMQEQDHLENGDYISDASAFDEVLHQLDTHDRPAFVHLVTMQNHLPMAEAYADPVGVTGDLDPKDAAEVAGDARGLAYSDQALDDFLTSLRRRDQAGGRTTVVVFYGDHYPGIYSDQVQAENPGDTMRRTPLLIWSSSGQQPRDLGLTSSNDFLPYVFDLVGEPLPPYYELLTEVREQIGPLGPGFDDSTLPPAQQELLDDYRMVQYDFSIGRRYGVGALWYAGS
jgi:hypothetical protein